MSPHLFLTNNLSLLSLFIKGLSILLTFFFKEPVFGFVISIFCFIYLIFITVLPSASLKFNLFFF